MNYYEFGGKKYELKDLAISKNETIIKEGNRDPQLYVLEDAQYFIVDDSNNPVSLFRIF
jgi:hypothetical protein